MYYTSTFYIMQSCILQWTIETYWWLKWGAGCPVHKYKQAQEFAVNKSLVLLQLRGIMCPKLKLSQLFLYLFSDAVICVSVLLSCLVSSISFHRHSHINFSLVLDSSCLVSGVLDWCPFGMFSSIGSNLPWFWSTS